MQTKEHEVNTKQHGRTLQNEYILAHEYILGKLTKPEGHSTQVNLSACLKGSHNCIECLEHCFVVKIKVKFGT